MKNKQEALNMKQGRYVCVLCMWIEGRHRYKYVLYVMADGVLALHY